MANSNSTQTNSLSAIKVNEPFAASADNFFHEPFRVQKLDLIYSSLCYGNSVIALTGPLGAGKTTLLIQLQKRIGRLQPTARINAYPDLTIEPLLDEAQRQFANALAAGGGMENAVGAVMLIDDADLLSDMVLRVLLTPVSGQEGRVRVMLTGKSELGERLLSFMDKTIPRAKIFELLPFPEEEAIRFIRSSLANVGINNHPVLALAVLKKLYRDTGGWPGAIITQTRQALAPTTPRPTKVSATPKNKPVAANPVNNNPNVTKHNSNINLKKRIRQTINAFWFWPAVGIVSLVAVLKILPTEPTPPLVKNSNNSLSTLATPPRLDNHNLEATPETVNQRAPNLGNNSKLEPLTNPLKPVNVVNQTNVQKNNDQNANTPKLAAVTTNNNSPPSNNKSTNLQSEQWLRTQNAKNYTLQIMSGNLEADLQEFLRRWEVTGDIAIAHTRRQGRDWYSLLYGTYPDYRQAQDAAKQFPAGMPKPWIRSIGSVQKDLEQ